MEAHAEIGLGSELPSGLREVIDLGLKAGASDWHLRAEEPCFLRVRGEIVNLDATSVTEGPCGRWRSSPRQGEKRMRPSPTAAITTGCTLIQQAEPSASVCGIFREKSPD